MAKKLKTGKNPWTGKKYIIREGEEECPDCKEESGAWNTVKSVGGYLKSESKILSDKRLAICEKCPHSKDLYNRGWINYCNICGCMLKIKTRLKSSKCPDGRW